MNSEETFSESENVMVQVSCLVLLKLNTRSIAEVMQFAVLGGLSFFLRDATVVSALGDLEEN